MRRASVLHVVENLDDSYGGPARSVPNLASKIRDAGWGVRLLSVQWKKGERNDVIARECLDWDRFKLVGPRKICFAPGIVRALGRVALAQGPLLHLHTLWNAVSVATIMAAQRQRLPLVVSVRGALYPWSLSQGRARKALAWRLFVRDALQRAAFIHVTEPKEADVVRALGINAPMITIPNGVEQIQAVTLRNMLQERRHRALIGLRILFLSRIHKKKGLDLLLQAWAKSGAPGQNARLDIAGPFASIAYEREIRLLVQQLGIRDSVSFRGMLTGTDREQAFREADVFVLPSHTENFGVAVVEALARGLPVLTTTGTPWQSIEQYGAGWWIDLSVEQLARHLDEIIGLSRYQLVAMGERATQLATRFDWHAQAGKMLTAYEWVLGGVKPDSLVMDGDT